MKEVFDLFDTNQTGVLGQMELEVALRSLGIQVALCCMIVLGSCAFVRRLEVVSDHRNGYLCQDGQLADGKKCL